MSDIKHSKQLEKSSSSSVSKRSESFRSFDDLLFVKRASDYRNVLDPHSDEKNTITLPDKIVDALSTLSADAQERVVSLFKNPEVKKCSIPLFDNPEFQKCFLSYIQDNEEAVARCLPKITNPAAVKCMELIITHKNTSEYASSVIQDIRQRKFHKRENNACLLKAGEYDCSSWSYDQCCYTNAISDKLQIDYSTRKMSSAAKVTIGAAIAGGLLLALALGCSLCFRYLDKCQRRQQRSDTILPENR